MTDMAWLDLTRLCGSCLGGTGRGMARATTPIEMSKDGDKPDKPVDGTPVKNPPPMKPLPRPLPPAPRPGGKQA